MSQYMWWGQMNHGGKWVTYSHIGYIEMVASLGYFRLVGIVVCIAGSYP